MLNLHVSHNRRKIYLFSFNIIIMTNSNIDFIENPSISGKEDKYKTVQLNMDKIIKSWENSLFSFEWLLPDGNVRTPEEMTEAVRIKYTYALSVFQDNQPIPMPILGIGVMENVEIVLMLHNKNIKTFDAHISVHDEEEFVPYLNE